MAWQHLIVKLTVFAPNREKVVHTIEGMIVLCYNCVVEEAYPLQWHFARLAGTIGTMSLMC